MSDVPVSDAVSIAIRTVADHVRMSVTTPHGRVTADLTPFTAREVMNEIAQCLGSDRIA